MERAVGAAGAATGAFAAGAESILTGAVTTGLWGCVAAPGLTLGTEVRGTVTWLFQRLEKLVLFCR